MATNATKKLNFAFERETKNTIRFAEQVAELDAPVIGTIYIGKHALKELGYTQGSTITIALAVTK